MHLFKVLLCKVILKPAPYCTNNKKIEEGSSVFVLVHFHRLKQKTASHVKLNYMVLYFHYIYITLYYCSWIRLFSMGSGLWLLNLTHFTQELPLIRLELRAELLWLTLQTTMAAEYHRLLNYFRKDIHCVNSWNWMASSRNPSQWAPQPWGDSSPWSGPSSLYKPAWLHRLLPQLLHPSLIHQVSASHSRISGSPCTVLGNENCGSCCFRVHVSFLN